MIKIISNGYGSGTEVIASNGEKLKGIRSIEIKEILPNSIVEAVITFNQVELDIMVEYGKET